MVLTFKLTRERLRPRTHPSHPNRLAMTTFPLVNIPQCQQTCSVVRCTEKNIRKKDIIYLLSFSHLNTPPYRSEHCHL
jgi:hypothetical protein